MTSQDQAHGGRWASMKKTVGEHKRGILLAALILAIIGVYGFRFFKSRPAQAGISPQVAAVLQKWHGKIPQFPMFGPPPGGFRRNWRTMTPAQRRAMWQKRRTRMQAFFLAFAHAGPQKQAAIIAAAKAHFKKMRHRFHGHGHFAAHMPQMMANHLIGGDPQFHAAMTGFFMGLRNSP